ncbi:Glucosamine 6-phosphate N-acetyltransferase [Linum perenne]
MSCGTDTSTAPSACSTGSSRQIYSAAVGNLISLANSAALPSLTFRVSLRSFYSDLRSQGECCIHVQSSKQMQSNDSSVVANQTFQVRKLQLSDKGKGFIELLQQLTVCESVSDKDFEDRFHELSSYGDDHLICVIEDDRIGKIVATGCMFVEKKFLRNCGKVGHIEDVVVDSCARGLHLGKKVVDFLTDHARSKGCYKVILDCSNENKAFYEKCGFKQKEIQMVQYFI